MKIRADAGGITVLLAALLSLSAPFSMPLSRYACRCTPAPRCATQGFSPRHPGAFAAPCQHSIRPTPARLRPTQALSGLTAGIRLLLTALTLHLRLPCAGRVDSDSTRAGIPRFSPLRPLLQVPRLPPCWSPSTCTVPPTPPHHLGPYCVSAPHGPTFWTLGPHLWAQSAPFGPRPPSPHFRPAHHTPRAHILCPGSKF